MACPVNQARPLAAATVQRTRPPVKAPVTVAEFMRLLARGLDESHMASRGGRR